MSVFQPLAAERRDRGDTVLHGSCAARVLILIDIAELPVRKGANGELDTARFVDGLRLSVLRVLTQLTLSCPQDSWVDWATRFFDSRQGGIGKTPAELKARLRSRQAAQGTRGFARATQASFEAFGDACLAVACGIQGDPLARDREAALRRWSRGRKKPPPTWMKRSDVSGGDVAEAAQPGRSEPAGALEGSVAATVGFEGPWEDGPRYMYDGHDMSSHEVVVRSLLEVLQEFGEAGEGDGSMKKAVSSVARATYGHDAPKLQLLVLHSAYPHMDEDVERFALQGNFTAEAARVSDKPPEEKAAALVGLLDAHLGKAVLRASSRGVSFFWQDGAADSNTTGRREESLGSTRCRGYLYGCLSAAGGAGVLRWGRVVDSTGLLPPSAALRCFTQRVDRWSGLGVSNAEMGARQHSAGAAVAVALNRQGVVDVHLVASTLSGFRHFFKGPGRDELAELPLVHAPPPKTPWRLMGTVPMCHIWPSCLLGQRWGETVVLQAEYGHGAQLWLEFLWQLRAGGMAAVIALPHRLFGCSVLTNSGHVGEDGSSSESLTVALVLPFSGDCALGWSVGGLEGRLPDGQENDGGAQAGAQLQRSGVRGQPLIEVLSVAAERRTVRVAPAAMPVMDGVPDGPTRAELTLKLREAEVGLAMQEASLVRRRRRQAKAVPGERARGAGNVSSSVSGAAERGAGSGRLFGSLSQRDSVSVCLTGEGTSGDGAASNVLQWRLEMASEASHGSVSPRGCRLFEAGAGATEDDDQTSSTGSSSGPRRALHQALEDVSSRSSLLGPDADSSSTPGSKEGSGWAAGAAMHRLHHVDSVSRGNRKQGEGLFATTDDAGEAVVDFSAVVDGGSSELPLSFMSEPALACLHGAPLPVDLAVLAERCARLNKTAAAAAVASASDAFGGSDPASSKPQCSGSERVGARRRFIDAVRSLERRAQAMAPDSGAKTATGEPHDMMEQAVHVNGDRREGPVTEERLPPDANLDGGGIIKGREQVSATGDHNGGGSDGPRDFEDRVRRGVTGLLRQYREVVEGGQRSPVEFVVHSVPEAIRDMTDDGKHPTNKPQGADDCQARAAQVLAAVVSGLTSTPQALGNKHRANRGARSAGTDADSATAVANPAIQKIRDYQLQALLMCQLHMLAMDLPDTVESLAAFSALSTSGAEEASSDGRDGKGKKGKGKGKGKKRRCKGSGTDDNGAPVRPCDPLPDGRRARLVDYLQPISTMLDACTVTRAPHGGGGRVDAGGGSGGSKGFQSRAYDGTLADFMGLALVEHFALRLPRTLAALFEDFECLPPDALAGALSRTSPSGSHATTGNTGGVGKDTGAQSGKESTAVVERASCVAEELAAAENVTGNEPTSASSRATSTAGILLSDRTALSHNHFKMSGVLNGFREVKLKAHPTSGGLRPSVVGGVSGNDQGGRGSSGGKVVEENGEWRTSSGAKGRRGMRPRAARDSKQPTGLTKRQPASGAKTASPMGIRQSPRLVRKRPGGAANEGDGVTKTKISASRTKRSLSSSAANFANASKRRQVTAPGEDIPRPRAGVLVDETPQKRSGDVAMRTGRRGGRAARAPQDDSPAPQAALPPAEVADRKCSMRISVRGQIHGSPAAPMGSPTTGPVTRRRAMDSASPDVGATTRTRRMPSPACWRAAPAASRLFVAESPGVSMGVKRGRSMWPAGDSSGDRDGIALQLATESASPVPRRRAVVPDTPA